MSAYHGLSHLEHGAVIPDGFDNRFMDLLHFYWEDKMAGNQIFKIGTFRRCKRTLEEQARKWGGELQLEKDLESVRLDILAQRDVDAINKLNTIMYNLQMTYGHLGDTIMAINNQDYATAESELNDAINIIEQNF